MSTSDILEGKWKQLKGRLRENWGDLTDDDVEQIGGQRDRLAGKLQEKYGYHKKEAEDKINSFLEKVS